jgi:hypothetical protein
MPFGDKGLVCIGAAATRRRFFNITNSYIYITNCYICQEKSEFPEPRDSRAPCPTPVGPTPFPIFLLIDCGGATDIRVVIIFRRILARGNVLKKLRRILV